MKKYKVLKKQRGIQQSIESRGQMRTEGGESQRRKRGRGGEIFSNITNECKEEKYKIVIQLKVTLKHTENPYMK